MKPHFSIRDFVWLLLLLAALTGWGVDRYMHSLVEAENKRLREDLSNWQKWSNQTGPEVDQLKIDIGRMKQDIQSLKASRANP